MNFEFYDEREKHTKDTRLQIFRSNAPYFRKFWRENTKETPNLEFGTRFNKRKIIFEKDSKEDTQL